MQTNRIESNRNPFLHHQSLVKASLAEENEIVEYQSNLIVSVESCVLQSNFKKASSKGSDSLLELTMEGTERPGRIGALLEPFDRAKANIQTINYAVMGNQHEFYRMVIKAEDAEPRVEQVFNYYSEHPLRFTEHPRAIY